MSETIRLGDITIAVTRKDITSTRPEVARAYAFSRLGEGPPSSWTPTYPCYVQGRGVT